MFPVMEHVRISLSPAHQAYLDEQVRSGGYASAGDYVAALITAEARAKAQVRLKKLLLEGLEGEATEWTDADTQRLQRLAVNGR